MSPGNEARILFQTLPIQQFWLVHQVTNQFARLVYEIVTMETHHVRTKLNLSGSKQFSTTILCLHGTQPTNLELT